MEIVLSHHGLNPGLVDFAKWISQGLARKGRGGGSELARLLGLSTVKISKMKSGERDPQAEELPIIESFFGETAPIKLRGAVKHPADKRRVRVVGYVGAGSNAHFYAISQGDLDAVEAPAGTGDNTVAVEIRGDSIGSWFNRWLVFYDDLRTPVTDDLIGKLCVIGTGDGRVLIKELRAAKKRGLFDLYSSNEPPLRNISVDWAAEVKAMAQRNIFR